MPLTGMLQACQSLDLPTSAVSTAIWWTTITASGVGLLGEVSAFPLHTWSLPNGYVRCFSKKLSRERQCQQNSRQNRVTYRNCYGGRKRRASSNFMARGGRRYAVFRNQAEHNYAFIHVLDFGNKGVFLIHMSVILVVCYRLLVTPLTSMKLLQKKTYPSGSHRGRLLGVVAL